MGAGAGGLGVPVPPPSGHRDAPPRTCHLPARGAFACVCGGGEWGVKEGGLRQEGGRGGTQVGGLRQEGGGGTQVGGLRQEGGGRHSGRGAAAAPLPLLLPTVIPSRSNSATDCLVFSPLP